MRHSIEKYDGRVVRYYSFNGIQDFVNFISTDNERCPTKAKEKDRFHGDTYENSMKELFGKNTNNQVVCNLSADLDKLLNEKEARSTKRKRNDMFGTLNIKDYSYGIDRCLTRRVRGRYEKKVLDVFVGIGYANFINGQTVLNRGATILSIIKKFREKYFVKLHLFSISNHSEDCFLTYTDVSNCIFSDITIDCSSEIDVQTITYILTKVEFFRRLFFMFYEKAVDNIKNLYDDAYGRTLQLMNTTIDKLYGEGDKRIVIQRADSNAEYETLKDSAQTLSEILISQLGKDEK